MSTGNGIISSMSYPIETTIDAAGRVVVPKEIRERARLVPGTRLRVQCVDGRVEIEPVPRAIRIVRKGRLHVAVPIEQGESLKAESVRDVIEEIRTGRRGE